MDIRHSEFIDKLLAEVSTLMLFRACEPDGNGSLSVHLDAVTLEGRRVNVERGSFSEALAALVASPDAPRKKCRRCKFERLLTEFSKSKSANTQDGRLPRCKLCERVRVGYYRNKARDAELARERA